MKNESSGDILNNTGTMEYHQANGQLAVTFRNMVGTKSLLGLKSFLEKFIIIINENWITFMYFTLSKAKLLMLIVQMYIVENNKVKVH